jgi:aminoglycoside phosphotransferase (APT) family kinase protein
VTAELESEPLEQHLRERLSDRENLRLTRLRRSPGGMSRETWFADVEWGPADDPRRQRLTVRTDHPHGAVMPTPLRFEHDVMRALYRTAIPVAEVLWYEHDPPWLGRDLYVRDNVPGDASPKRMFAEEGLRAKIGRRLVELLADLHTVDWRAAGMDEFMDVPEQGREAALLELEKWRQFWAQTAVEPKPALAELYAWLERNAPEEVARISIVWGDVGVGNFIYRDDDIVALTDWEQAHLGDPMKDIAAALWRGIEDIVSKDEFYSIYQERSGIPIDEKSVEYYSVFIDAQYTTTSSSVFGLFTPESVPDVTFARLGLGISYRCLDLGFRAIGV